MRTSLYLSGLAPEYTLSQGTETAAQKKQADMMACSVKQITETHYTSFKFLYLHLF